MKEFSKEFDKFKDKLKKEENFALARFSDGETFILKGEELSLSETGFVTGDRKGHGIYPIEEQKKFNPEKDKFYQDRLIDAFTHRKKNYYKGLLGREDEDIAGDSTFQFQLDLYGSGDDEHLTYSNVFINANYPRFLKELIPLLVNRKIVLVCNENADLSNFVVPVVKDFRVGTNCIINDYALVERIKEWITENNIRDHVFLCSASTLGNYIIHQCFEDCDDNTFLDIGSALSPWMKLEGWKYSRAYLQHWILGMPNKYGIQEDKWN